MELDSDHTWPRYTDGSFAACGENIGIKVFRSDGSTLQHIPVPAMSVWSVDVMANGDLVAGTSDNKIYVFTKDEDRMAPPELMVRNLRTQCSKSSELDSISGSFLNHQFGT